MFVDISALQMKFESACIEKALYRKWGDSDFKKLIETQDRLMDTKLFLLISVVANVALVATIFALSGKVCV